MGCPTEVIIGDNLTFSITTHDPDTGVVTDAGSAPSYRVYEDETPTAILTGSLAKLDDANTTGFYTETIACTAANGFESGKTYTVYIEATVDGDKGAICYGFKATTKAGFSLANTGADLILKTSTFALAIADAICDELLDGHTTADTLGLVLNELQDGGRLDLILDDIDTEVDEIHTAVHNITVTGSALNVIAVEPTVAQPATGTESSGTWASTNLHDGVYHITTAATNEIDIYYQFPVPTTGAPVSVQITGYLKEGVPAGGDTIDAYAYDFVTPGWDKITDSVFTGITTNGPAEEVSIVLFARHASAGVCRVRFQATSLEANTTLNIDQIYVSYAESVAASIALILADTGELQTNQTAWATAAGFAVPGDKMDLLDTIMEDV